jgi:hypothetical protein
LKRDGPSRFDRSPRDASPRNVLVREGDTIRQMPAEIDRLGAAD